MHAVEFFAEFDIYGYRIYASKRHYEYSKSVVM